MSDGVLSALKIGLLLLIYLFFFRVLRAVWNQLKEPRVITVAAPIATSAAPTIHAPTTSTATTPTPTASRSITSAHPKISAPSLVQPTLVSIPMSPETPPVTVTHSPFAIGRSRLADLILDDNFASQRHAVIVHTGDVWTIADAGSTNGTSVNGQKISAPVELSRGDRLGIGSHQFEVT